MIQSTIHAITIIKDESRELLFNRRFLPQIPVRVEVISGSVIQEESRGNKKSCQSFPKVHNKMIRINNVLMYEFA